MTTKNNAAAMGSAQFENDSARFYTGTQDVAANDATHPAALGWGRHWQLGREENERWTFATEAEWPNLQAQTRPMFCTALEIDGEWSDDAERAAKYRGDMYLDWDSPVGELAFAIADVNDFLNDLQGKGVKLECLRIYATGGRGFHVEIPWGVYSSERADKGEQYLPHIYREMARQMVGRYLDLSIYSAKRGRMWRQPNVQRENGNYKVPLTLDEMRRMTPEMYEEFCKAPRPEPERAEPVLCAEMLAMFSNARTRAQQQAKKPARPLFRLVELPDTLSDVMTGKRLRDGVGFNELALQLAVAAHALGWIIDTLLEATTELRAGWRGDAHRTPEQCAAELRRMFRYTADNAGYAYAPNAIRALMVDTADTDDLTGEPDLDAFASCDIKDAKAALAEMEPLAFDRVKHDVAKALRVGATKLDEEVGRERRKRFEAAEKAQAEAEAAQSRAGTVSVVDPEPEPWPEPVDGAAMLSGIAKHIQRFIHADQHVIDAAALWAAQTYLADVARHSPLAHITAAQKRCGKSTLLEVLGGLVRRPLAAAQISPAALYRTLEVYKPTLMLDEFDQLPKELKAELTGLLNAGHSRTAAKVVKVDKVGDDLQPVAFSVYGPKAISGIGNIADTLADRSIRLQLKRRLPGEQVDSLYDAADECASNALRLRRQLIRWSADHAETVKNTRPKRLERLHDRMMDNWATMLAVADIAGGEWPERARDAAVGQLGLFGEGLDYKSQLLADVREVFAEAGDAYIGISAQLLLKRLCSDPSKPWATFSGGSKELTAHRLTGILQEFGIKPDRRRNGSGGVMAEHGEKRPSAYLFADFEETFARYLQAA